MDRTENDVVAEVAAALAGAYSSREAVPSQAGRITGVANGYIAQQRNVEIWRSAGRRPVGRKIGLTSMAAQTAFGTEQPMVGTLFADMDVDDGSTVPYSELFSPRVEGEIAFVLRRDLDMPDPGLTDIIRAVDFILPAIEIVDTRYGRWDVGVSDAVADNGAAGLFVLGAQPRSLRDIDLKLCGMTLAINGEPVSTGAGLACLGNPLNAVRWLARKAAAGGNPLREGEVVLSGALGPMLAVAAGDHVSVSISDLNTVDVIFSGAKDLPA